MPTDRSRLTDADLVARCRAGDDAAWTALAERFRRYVLAIAARGYGLSETDAEEVLQDVLVRTFEHLHRLRDDAAVRPWIGQLTRRTCIDRIRAGLREQPVADLPEHTAADPELERLADVLAMREALGTLRPDAREILERFYARDESYRAIGTALAIPPGTIASRLARGLRRLAVAYAGGDLSSSLARA